MRTAAVHGYRQEIAGRNHTWIATAIAAALLLAFSAPAVALDYTSTRLSAGPAGGNGAHDASLAATSADGGRAVLLTTEQLTADDTDAAYDLYARDGDVTTRLSGGPNGGNGPYDAFLSNYTPARDISRDGRHVFFMTAEALTADDTDSLADVYENQDGVTRRISISDLGGNGPYPAFPWDASDDGTHAYFTTDEPLTADDTDGDQDVYERAGGTTTRVSTGVLGGNGAIDAFYEGSSSADGSLVWFSTREALTNDDLDMSLDLYERAGGVTRRVSGTPGTGNGSANANFAGASADGSRVLFSTMESLVAADTDSSADIYERVAGTITLVTAGAINGNGAFTATYVNVSTDGAPVFFNTEEKLTADDTDTSIDTYERAAGVTTRVTTGPLGGNGAQPADVLFTSADGSRAFFRTAEKMTADDLDASRDVYERAGGVTTLVSTGPRGNGPFDADLMGVSTDGARVFFETGEALVPADTDPGGTCEENRPPPPGPCVDVYERAGGETSLLSGPNGGGGGAVDSNFAGASDDGRRAFFVTKDRVTPDDTDDRRDVFAAVPLAPVPQQGVEAIADTDAPSIGSLRMLRKRFRVGAGRTPVSARRKKRTPAGTAFRFRLSEAATVKITIERPTKGRRLNGRCRRATAKLRKRRRCTRYVNAGTLTRAAKAGANSTSFSGRVGRRALRPARYRVSLVATDNPGNRSRVRRTTFTIVRR